MFKKVLIANRGEIAVRIIRTLREMGISPVVAYSQADINSLPLRLADKTVCIGPASASQSYLNTDAIIAAAEITGADAIHPGYGFLSENADFAQACSDSGITFIGPSAETILKLGDKAGARRMAVQAGIPVTPGTDGCVTPENYELEAAKTGFPLMIKATAGGGGKGIRVVRDMASLKNELQIASAEAMSAFGNSDVYFEKYLENPRHIEMQFVRDSKGNTVTFPERDCSIQRRHQKLIEETPSSAVSEQLRNRLSRAAMKLAETAGYVGAGTVEFLLDREGGFWFMEVNTRLQVEHPVTEAVTGTDLVREQILAAAGEPLSIPAGSLAPHGHAIEFRINAEDPEEDFRPGAGTIQNLFLPGGPGVRTDTHLYTGYSLPVFYDSLIAKLIVHAADRGQAVNRAARALRELEITGIKTTVPFHMSIIQDSDFRSGHTHTGFAEAFIAGIKKNKKQDLTNN